MGERACAASVLYFCVRAVVCHFVANIKSICTLFLKNKCPYILGRSCIVRVIPSLNNRPDSYICRNDCLFFLPAERRKGRSRSPPLFDCLFSAVYYGIWYGFKKSSHTYSKWFVPSFKVVISGAHLAGLHDYQGSYDSTVVLRWLVVAE